MIVLAFAIVKQAKYLRNFKFNQLLYEKFNRKRDYFFSL
jgi:hypothetical protein